MSHGRNEWGRSPREIPPKGRRRGRIRNTGHTQSGTIAALRDEPGIRMITTRHEAGATHMADGYSRGSGKPGVALVVPGTGVYNAASGVATAYARSSPVLLIAGQIPRGQTGKNLGAIHEVFDQSGVMSPVTKWRRQVLRPRDVPGAVTRSIQADAYRAS